MSYEHYEELIKAFPGLRDLSDSLGCELKNPDLTLASTVLMSVPALGLTDSGYVDARSGELVSTILETIV